MRSSEPTSDSAEVGHAETIVTPLELALQRCGAGDRAAFEIVYDGLIELVWQASELSASDVASREQLVRDVFVTMWREAPRFDPEKSSPADWALALTTRSA